MPILIVLLCFGLDHVLELGMYSIYLKIHNGEW